MSSEVELEFLSEGLSRKSPLPEWEKWARIIVRDYPDSLATNVFVSSFLHGLGPKNLTLIRDLGAINTLPNPAPEALERANRFLDPVGVLLLMHEIEVPMSARLIIQNFFYERGILTVDEKYFNRYFIKKEGDY